ncbi:flavodoxin [Atopomonas sediminilitoris]|uniref:flavodoxin n=1 Tax=Atopomonas sediminilitoris TaxID=2919919 RepID=UPI001F4EDA8A|nr:flavodoxin [Atopomonas sediminilitoris]MCJ8170192.1 flavodoxin [Atopomonas sediminilitoris]
MKIAILSGSVYGAAEEVAHAAAEQLNAAGLEAWHKPKVSLDELLAFAPDALLAVTSTTGMGELPDSLMPLFCELRERFPQWMGKPAAVIALGDASYGDTFCAGGEQLHELLFAELGLSEALPMLRLDASESVTPVEDSAAWLAELATQLA